MWHGIIPAVTTKFNEDDTLDFKETERCYGTQMDSGCDGLIACGPLGEGRMYPSSRHSFLPLSP